MLGLRRFAATLAAIATLGAAVTAAADQVEPFRYFRMTGSFGYGPAAPGSDGHFAIAIEGPSVVFAGNSYSFVTRIANAQGQVSFAVQSGQLPAGISLNPATGGLSGTINAIGFTEAIIEGTDGGTGETATATLAINAVEALKITAAAAPTTGAVASPYLASFQVQGGTQPYEITSSSLPSGLTFGTSATSATISGTPSSRGSQPISIDVRDRTGLTASYAYDLTVGPSNDPSLGVTISAPTQAMVGRPYTAEASISGGYAAGGYTATLEGSLPFGLAIDATSGSITGTPSVAGNFGPLTVSIADTHDNAAANAPFSIAVSPSLQLSADVPPATTGYAYSGATFTAAGGTAPYVFAVSTGALPAGLTLDPSSGAVAGSPGAACACGFTVTATDAHGFTKVVSATLTVTDPTPVTISGTPPSAALVGDPYTAQFVAAGGDGNFTFTLDAGSLPTGLTLASTGIISGSPSSTGSFAGIRVRVTDGHGATASSQPFTLSVTIPPLTIATPAVPDSFIGTALNVALSAAGGSRQGYVFSWSGAGSLPSGMLFDASAGTLSGTPFDYYDQSLVFKVSDSLGNSASTSPVRIHILGPLSISGIPEQNATTGTFYQATQPRAYGGSETGYTYDVVSGALPPGLTLGASGFISGIPTSAGSFDNLRIRVTDSSGATAISPSFSIVVIDSGASQADPVSAAFTSVALPVRVARNQPFAITLEGYGGYNTGPYEFHPDATLPLPHGVTVDQHTGTISGSIAALGTYPLRVVVVDVSQPDQPSGYSEQGNVVVSEFTVDTSPDPGFGRVGQPMNMSVVASGGAGPFTYSVGSGTLPPGLSLNPSTGAIAGTPTIPGGWMLTFIATNGTGTSIESLQIPINISSSTDGACYATGAIGPGAEVGYWVMATPFSPNSGTVTSYDISGAPLPNGVSWEPTVGLPLGAPTTAGNSGPMFVTPQDSGGGQCASSAALGPFFIETVDGLSFDTFDLPQASVGSAYTTTLQASAGKPGSSGSGYWFALQMDQKMPPGLSLDHTTGAITGVPKKSGTYGLDLTVTDAWGFQAFNSLTLTVQ